MSRERVQSRSARVDYVQQGVRVLTTAVGVRV